MEAATTAAAQSSQSLLQYGAIGAMLVLCVLALVWIFLRMDKRLEETQKSADADRKEYTTNMMRVAESTSAHIAKSTEILERVAESQAKSLEHLARLERN